MHVGLVVSLIFILIILELDMIELYFVFFQMCVFIILPFTKTVCTEYRCRRWKKSPIMCIFNKIKIFISPYSEFNSSYAKRNSHYYII